MLRVFIKDFPRVRVHSVACGGIFATIPDLPDGKDPTKCGMTMSLEGIKAVLKFFYCIIRV